MELRFSHFTVQDVIRNRFSKLSWLYNYGYTLFLADNEEESIPYLTKAIEIKPTLELYRTRGVAYLLTGKRALACDDIYAAYDGGDEKADKWLRFC